MESSAMSSEGVEIQLSLSLCVSSAYKEKVKELPLVSLFCSCINPQTAEKPTYKAEGKNKLLHTPSPRQESAVL